MSNPEAHALIGGRAEDQGWASLRLDTTQMFNLFIPRAYSQQNPGRDPRVQTAYISASDPPTRDLHVLGSADYSPLVSRVGDENMVLVIDLDT